MTNRLLKANGAIRSSGQGSVVVGVGGWAGSPHHQAAKCQRLSFPAPWREKAQVGLCQPELPGFAGSAWDTRSERGQSRVLLHAEAWSLHLLCCLHLILAPGWGGEDGDREFILPEFLSLASLCAHQRLADLYSSLLVRGSSLKGLRLVHPALSPEVWESVCFPHQCFLFWEHACFLYMHLSRLGHKPHLSRWVNAWAGGSLQQPSLT